MNILDVQNKLKNFSEEQLVQEMQAPTGNAPQFLVLSEIQRRKRMRDDLQQQQAQPVKTVAEEAIAAGGVPQGGIGQLAGAMGQGSSNAQMPQQQAPEQQPQGMYGGGIVKLAPGGMVGGEMRLVPVGNGKVIIVDESNKPLSGQLSPAEAQMRMNDLNAINDGNIEAADAPLLSPSERMAADANKVSAFDNPNVRRGESTDRGGIGAILEATTPPATTQTGVTPEATAKINRLADARRGVPLAALERKMAKERMNITGPSVFDNPADVPGEPPKQTPPAPVINVPQATERRDPTGESTNPLVGMSQILAGVPALQKENLAYTPGRLANTVREVLSLKRPDTEKRDPSGEPPKKTPPATTPDNVVPEPNSTADDPRSPGGFGAMSPYETELMNMLKSKEKQAEQDKWMSLAKAGLAMMSSKSPNFGVAFGEGAAAGLEDYQAQKSQYETDRLALLGGVEKSRLGREAAARAGQGKPNTLSMNALYTGLQNQLEAQANIISDPLVGPDVKAAAMENMKNLQERISRIEATAGVVDVDATKIS
jgi:hypothetical protein